MATAIEILNTIRDNMDTETIARIPENTLENLPQIGKAITSDKNIMNSFMNALVNKVALSMVKSKMFYNPLSKLKQSLGGRPMGSTIEEIFVNPSKDQGFQTDSTYLLKTNKPDGKACYYGLNRQSNYPTTISKQELIQAFTSERSFMQLFDKIVTTLYSGDQIDEFTLCKKLFAKAIDEGGIRFIESDISQPKELAKAISNMSDYFCFPSTEYCGYNNAKENQDKFTSKAETKCITFCPTENQVLLIRADVLNEINYEVLASMFHMEMANLKAMTIKVDSFPTEKDVSNNKKDVYAILCDIEALQIYDHTMETDNQYIGVNMYYNLWLNHWQWLYISMFANCVAFGKTITVTE